ncbi:MAG: alpha/beta hydrolase [Chloroflexi bacterium]|nr:alpha/beta hydrolase [Chloroflexota bacterium]MBV9601465.1 alpha/beta hydrolase [Chloroflexota bacterium]
METSNVAVRDGAFEVELRQAGAGDHVVWLHGEAGPSWNGFHDALARQYHVLAPSHPGYSTSTGGDQLDDIHDAIYFYLDLLDALDLRQATLVGHGLGGMFAAELAAVQPARFSHLVLVDPFGLWLPEAPTLDYFVLPPAELAQALYHDPNSPAAQATARAPEGQEALIAYMLERAQSMAAAARYLWPIPDRGLSKRLHRVAAPTLIVWGQSDRVVPPVYAPEWQRRIAGSRLVIRQDAGHVPHVEQPAALAELTQAFLRDGSV